MSKSKNVRRRREDEIEDEAPLKDKWFGMKGRRKKNWTKSWMDTPEKDEDDRFKY